MQVGKIKMLSSEKAPTTTPKSIEEKKFKLYYYLIHVTYKLYYLMRPRIERQWTINQVSSDGRHYG